jgi:hypothetical protein
MVDVNALTMRARVNTRRIHKGVCSLLSRLVSSVLEMAERSSQSQSPRDAAFYPRWSGGDLTKSLAMMSAKRLAFPPVSLSTCLLIRFLYVDSTPDSVLDSFSSFLFEPYSHIVDSLLSLLESAGAHQPTVGQIRDQLTRLLRLSTPPHEGRGF